jgi:hypothetical protein
MTRCSERVAQATRVVNVTLIVVSTAITPTCARRLPVLRVLLAAEGEVV